MSKRSILVGTTGVTEYLFFQDPNDLYGAGLTGLSFNTVGLHGDYVKNREGTQLITLLSQTPTGPFLASGFCAISNINMPGVYRFDLPDVLWTEGQTNVITNIHMSGVYNTIIPVVLEYDIMPAAYHARVRMDRDTVGNVDEYGVLWYKNAVPLQSGQITTPQINVIKFSDGTDLVATTAMSYVSVNTGAVKYIEPTNKIAVGEPYIIRVLANIDGSTRVWQEVVARDS